jgi:dihydrofolate reductase
VRKIVFQMMTTLDGRLDDPAAWVTGVGDDQYRAIDRMYASYDTVLVGRTTYEEMAAYWPGELASGKGTEPHRSMARRMNDYKKIVFSRAGGRERTAWNNSELVVAGDDEQLAAYLTRLKSEKGGHIHLSGGASLAQAVIGLGLVDEFFFLMYPVVSRGASWHARLPDGRGLRLLSASTFENGVVGLHYAPGKDAGEARPESFNELIEPA